MSSQPADVAAERASHLIALGRAADAVPLLRSALADEPADPGLGCHLARALLAAGAARDAAGVAERVVGAHPDDEWALRLLALALRAQGLHERAVEVARAAVAAEPGSWMTHHVLADCLVTAPRGAKEAVVVARHTVALAPLEADAHAVLGLAAHTAGSRRLARAAYREALALDPTDADVVNNLTHLDEGVRPLRSARGYLSALALEPQDATMRKNLHRTVDEAAGWVLLGPVVLAAAAFLLSVDWWWWLGASLAWLTGGAVVLRRESAAMRRLLRYALVVNAQAIGLMVGWVLLAAVVLSSLNRAAAPAWVTGPALLLLIVSAVAGLRWIGRRNPLR